MKQKRQESNRSLRTVLLFCFLVGLLIVVSLTIKTVSLIRESTFDGKNQYILAVTTDKKSEIISFHPLEKSIGVLKVNNSTDSKNLKRALSIPIDGYISLKEDEKTMPSVVAILEGTIKRGMQGSDHLTIYDVVRLYLFAKSIPENKIIQREIRLPLEKVFLQDFVKELMTDQHIVDDNISIAIINSTGESGYGARLENVLLSIGGNVVAVSTASKSTAVSKIQYTRKKSYTLERLERILGFPIEEGNQDAVSDILVTIGKDAIDTEKF